MFSIGIIPPDRVHRVVENIGKNMSGQPSYPQELTLIRKDGGFVETEISSMLITLGNERVILGIARDITHRKKNQNALFASEEKFRRIIAGFFERHLHR